MNARRTELGRVRRNRQITAGHELTARRGGDARHFGDHRLGAVDDALHHARAHGHDFGEVRFAAIRARAARCHFLQIMTGTKGRTIGGKDDDTHRRVLPGIGNSCAQSAQHRFGKRIAAGHIIKRETQDTIITQFREENVCRSYGALLQRMLISTLSARVLAIKQ